MDQHLRVFVTVAEKQNFSRAAEELHLTQPAVSIHVQALEVEYGVKLLERSNKRVELTKAGALLYQEAKQILRQYAQMKRLVDDLLENESGPLSIGASYTFGEYVLPHIISGFRAKYPRITPSIRIENTTHVAEQIVRRELDAGIVEGDLSHPSLIVTPFMDDTMVVIVPSNHRFAEAFEVDAEALSSDTWIVRELGSGTREVSDRVLHETGIVPAATMSFGSTQIIKESVEAGLGIAIVSEVTIRKELALGTLRSLRIRNYPILRKFSWVVHAGQIRTKAMDVFIEYLTGDSALPERTDTADRASPQPQRTEQA